MGHNPITFGKALRASRLRAGLTQFALAELAGVSPRTVRYIESAEVARPRRESVRRLARALQALGEVPWTTEGEVRIEVLGPLEVKRGGRPIPLGTLKQRCLFATLALRPNEVVGRDEVIDALWGDQPPASCNNLLNTYVSGVRGFVDGGGRRGVGSIISRVGLGYRLAVDDEQTDVTGFLDLVTVALSTPDLFARKQSLERALDLWRGPVLDDLPRRVRLSPAAVALAGRRVQAALAYADAALAVGAAQDAVDRLRPMAHHEPLHEPLHARLMLAYAAAGQQAAALRAFSDIRLRLDEELGVQPGREIRLAHTEVLSGERVPPHQPGGPALDGGGAVLITGLAAEPWPYRVRDRGPEDAVRRLLRGLAVSADRVRTDDVHARTLFR
ncbi:DNA-binding SARP family transcriptional activator/DNA-binding XRE family transcriptional regulator [Actinokineospora baliensis]|uniref:BTAD domain-containing putative transcriptional regulator n=1 Tax=Actinokineospora baliensis TaxID=547056 RepID=UPI00195A4D38|nr:BTAD domain-containing putative transcriptional regulator [Actinokineospora baliensis]MBM7772265.1 DNA-binding SARP family transcriptional activator/DNA-binding XRE family transcriptional regulator [Actinokineospora baliensis]